MKITQIEKKRIESLIKKAVKKENETFSIMQKNGYDSLSYDLKKKTLYNIGRNITSMFYFYPIYYNASNFETLNSEKIINILNGYKTNEKKELLSFVYGITFKKDNVLNFQKDSSKLWEFLYSYLKGKKLNSDVMNEYFKVIKEYVNGKTDYKVNSTLYEYLQNIANEEYRDDKKVLKYLNDNLQELKKRGYYFEHFPVNKVLDLMQKNDIIKEFSDINCNYVRLNPIVKKAIN